MKIRVTPQYGFSGFRLSEGNQAIDLPPVFTFEAEIVESGEPFKVVLGLVTESEHPLSNQWVSLWQRTLSEQPTYNLTAFSERPLDLTKDRPHLTGFALAERVSYQ